MMREKNLSHLILIARLIVFRADHLRTSFLKHSCPIYRFFSLPQSVHGST